MGCGVGDTAGVKVGVTCVGVDVATSVVPLAGGVVDVSLVQEEKVRSKKKKSNVFVLYSMFHIIGQENLCSTQTNSPIL